MRRPAVPCAVGFTAGIAVCDAAGKISFLLSAAGFLLLFFLNICNFKEKNKINVNKGGRNKSEETATGKEKSLPESDAVLAGRFPFSGQLVNKTIFVFLLFFIMGSLRFCWFEGDVSYFCGKSGQEAELTGVVLSEQLKEDRRVFEIRVRQGNGFGEKILITVKDGVAAEKDQGLWNTANGQKKTQKSPQPKQQEVFTGHFIQVTGTLREPESAGNPGVFDYRRYLKSRGIRMTLQAEAANFSVKQEAQGVYRILNGLARFRRIYLSAASETMNYETAGLLAGIMFGDRTQMEESVYEDFQKNGTAHLLAVSGLHISMIYGLLSALSRNPVTAAGNLPAAVILVMYAALSGFSPSVVRAVFMILIHIGAQIFHRRYDGLSCISFCAFCLLMYRPSMLFSAGFQLSFLAVLTISVVMPHADAGGYGSDRRRAVRDDGKDEAVKMGSLPREKSLSEGMAKWKKSAAGMFLMQAGMMPMTLRQFHYISPAAFLLNPPAIALAGLIVPAGVVMMPFSVLRERNFLPDVLQKLIDQVFGLLCNTEEMLLRLLTFLNELPQGTPFDYRYMASPPSAVFLFYYGILFFFCSEGGRAFVTGTLGGQHLSAGHKKNRKSAGVRVVCLLFVFALISGAAGFWTDRPFRAGDLTFIDIGQGDCAHLKDGDTDILFDSGGSDTYDVGENVLLPYFLAGGVSELDLAVISHLHTDHCGGLDSMIRGVKIKKNDAFCRVSVHGGGAFKKVRDSGEKSTFRSGGRQSERGRRDTECAGAGAGRRGNVSKDAGEQPG